MKCNAVCSKLSEYLFGELSPQRSAAIRDHLASCTDCRCRMASLERALNDLKRPMTFFEAPDVLADVKAQTQGRRRPVFRMAAAYGLSCVSALLLMYWIHARPSVQVAPKRPSTVKMENPVKEVAQAQGLEQAAAAPMPHSAASVKRTVQRQLQSRNHTQVATPEPTRVSDSIADKIRVPTVAATEPEPSSVALSSPDVSPAPERAPGELRYQYINGQGYVFREANVAPDGSPVRVDVMAVPVNDVPVYACMDADRLARAEHMVKRQEGAM